MLLAVVKNHIKVSFPAGRSCIPPGREIIPFFSFRRDTDDITIVLEGGT
jgi:hypothetical protein